MLLGCTVQKGKHSGDIKPASHVEIGKFYLSRGEYENAVKAFTLAIKTNSNNATLYFYRGQGLIRLKLYSKAIDDFSRAIDLRKDYVDAYINKALAYASINNLEEAQKELQEALKLTNDNPAIFYNLGHIALMQQHFD